MKEIRLKVSDELHAELQAEAKARGLSITGIIRELLGGRESVGEPVEESVDGHTVFRQLPPSRSLRPKWVVITL